MSTTHVSIDLETLSLRHDALILSIGAVKFDPNNGAIRETFERVIDLAGPCGTIDASTVSWWMQQSQEARDRIFGEGVKRDLLHHALVDFSEWLGFDDYLEDDKYPDVYLWQRGDRDMLWLASAYEGCGLKLPVKYNQYGDMRPLATLFEPFLPPYPEVAHTALGDATYQAQCIGAVFTRLNSVGAFGPALAMPGNLLQQDQAVLQTSEVAPE